MKKNRRWDILNLAYSISPNSSLDLTYYMFKVHKKEELSFLKPPLKTRWRALRLMIVPNGIYDNPKKATIDADVIFSDKVISMNDKVNINKKLSNFKKFRIDKKLMDSAKKDCIFLHCLPRGREVDQKVFLSKQSKVWLQALNRVHVQKSILLYCLGKLR